eukprot:gb/GECG01015700.1/.p1 GENE.gb/GECG01015700.1/~~gb/GECG01015700.1/.p1  ORF type:complete len:498 (+),score=45.94 gb/GECG01015700.1/:1-1494(+)
MNPDKNHPDRYDGKKGKTIQRWTQEEDDYLLRLINSRYPEGVAPEDVDWKTIATRIRGRAAKQCKERYTNVLHPYNQRTAWSSKELGELFRLHKEKGNKWRAIADELPGRSETAVKNIFYSSMRKLDRLSEREGRPVSPSFLVEEKRIHEQKTNKVSRVYSGRRTQHTAEHTNSNRSTSPKHKNSVTPAKRYRSSTTTQYNASQHPTNGVAIRRSDPSGTQNYSASTNDWYTAVNGAPRWNEGTRGSPSEVDGPYSSIQQNRMSQPSSVADNGQPSEGRGSGRSIDQHTCSMHSLQYSCPPIQNMAPMLPDSFKAATEESETELFVNIPPATKTFSKAPRFTSPSSGSGEGNLGLSPSYHVFGDYPELSVEPNSRTSQRLRDDTLFSMKSSQSASIRNGDLNDVGLQLRQSNSADSSGTVVDPIDTSETSHNTDSTVDMPSQWGDLSTVSGASILSHQTTEAPQVEAVSTGLPVVPPEYVTDGLQSQSSRWLQLPAV